jgi:hypothetical protein
MPDTPLSSAARLRAQEDQLQETINRAQRELATVKRASENQRTRLERSEEITTLKKSLDAAAERVRRNPSDENLIHYQGLKQKLKSLTPEPEPQESEEANAKPRSMCAIDGVVMRPDGTCPVNKTHTIGRDPYAGMKADLTRVTQVQRW